MNRNKLGWLVLGSILWAASPAAGADKAPAALKPINLEKLNTENDEDDPHVGSNGLYVLYTLATKDRAQVLMSVRRPADKTWPKGKPLFELQGKPDCRSVFVTVEGRYPQHLYFATNRDPEKSTQRGDNYDIYYLIKQDRGAEFTTATPMHFCTEQDELHPWMTPEGPDGVRLYYSRKTKDGWRVYLTHKPRGAQFSKAEKVALPVGFHHPTLTPDGKTMYLQGPLENDRWGLFRTTWDGKTWANPEALEFNDPEATIGDKSPCLSRDGSTLFFSSDRAGGKGGLDLWMVALPATKKKK